MVREIDYSKPLSKKDIAWLRQRKPESHVQRLIELAGSEDGDGPETGSTPDDGTGQPSGSDGSGDGNEAPAGDPQGDSEDLIGGDVDETLTDFDPSTHTVAEVEEHLKDASESEHLRVLTLERAGKARSSLVG